MASVFAEDDDDEEVVYAREQQEEKLKELEAQKVRAGKRNLDLFMEEMRNDNFGANNAISKKQLRMGMYISVCLCV